MMMQSKGEAIGILVHMSRTMLAERRIQGRIFSAKKSKNAIAGVGGGTMVRGIVLNIYSTCEDNMYSLTWRLSDQLR